MQTASTPESTDAFAASRARCAGFQGIWAAGLLSLAALLVAGCVSRPAVLVEDLLVPIAAPAPWLPSESDLAAAQLAREALVAPPSVTAGGEAIVAESVEQALLRLEQSASEPGTERLWPIARDLRNATLDDPIAYREASRILKAREKVDPRLESRLDRIVADDPLRLARRRQLDDWQRLWARTFNTVSEPLGSSLITGFVLAPFQLTNSVLHYLAEFSNTEPLSSSGRQALAHRKDFLAVHPETELTGRLEDKIDRATLRLEKTLALRHVRVAETSLDQGRPDLSAYHAGRTLEILGAHPGTHSRLERRAGKIDQRAHAEIARRARLRKRSLQATATPTPRLDIEYRLANRILAGPLAFDTLETDLAVFSSGGGSRDRIEFIRAIAQHENGFEAAARTRLEKLVAQHEPGAGMARHGRTLLENDWQSPYLAFERLRRKARRDELAWRLAGEWMERTRYPNLPSPLAYLIDTPTIAITIVLAPLRAIMSPWTGGPDFERAAALAGYRYLVRFPSGAEQPEVLDWLYEYEMRHEQFGRALRLADMMPDFDAKTRQDLVEKTAKSRLAHVERLDRRDTRASLLKGVAQEFPDSDRGREAGLAARAEALDASAQHIRITKEFLLENPAVAGRQGIGLNPRLLDGDPANGELHPEGVVLRGGRTLEIRLIADGAEDDEQAPETMLRKAGRDRLAQIAARLDEAVHRNGLADLDARQDPDANRDVYLERAGLGLTEDADLRPTAESTFIYRSLRERYGMVRGRDSILPFDLVFRGSLGDLSLGAFPRWRAPRETPDSFLYR